MSNLKTKIGNIELKNPVLLASGTCGVAGREFEPYFKLSELGGIVSKSLSIKPRTGNPTPRIAELTPPCGMLNSIGLQNPGIDYFIENELPYLKETNATSIVNIVGESMDDYLQATQKIAKNNQIAAIELNLSCPNVKGGLDFSRDEKKAYELVTEVKKLTNLPIWAKLSPNVTDITTIAKGCVDAGCDGLSLINTVIGLAIDIEKRKPILPRAVGGYSGPGVKPIALRMVWEVRKTFKEIPIIGIGGIHTTNDAIEFLLAGANCFQIGTATFNNPNTCTEIISGLEEYLSKNKINSIEELISDAHSEKELAKTT